MCIRSFSHPTILDSRKILSTLESMTKNDKCFHVVRCVLNPPINPKSVQEVQNLVVVCIPLPLSFQFPRWRTFNQAIASWSQMQFSPDAGEHWRGYPSHRSGNGFISCLETIFAHMLYPHTHTLPRCMLCVYSVRVMLGLRRSTVSMLDSGG